MVSLMFILTNFIIALIYLKYPKKLHPIQAAACYMFSVIYTHNFLVIPSVNLEDWVITKRADYGLIINLNAVLAVPISILLFIEKLEDSRNYLHKVFIFVVWVALILLFEYVHHWLGMVYHKNWKMGWSVVIWSFLGVILIIGNKIIKRMIMKIGDTV